MAPSLLRLISAIRIILGFAPIFASSALVATARILGGGDLPSRFSVTPEAVIGRRDSWTAGEQFL
jgi:hypothetical protein